ncbi:hypothetical protein SDC9_207711 [bioreactor metagenome]|uniref:Uncharacterized protein n=1 Tax=bioreactor metagenome TaxID=1076179 RepID=A0A645J8I2_9ZZZZ
MLALGLKGFTGLLVVLRCIATVRGLGVNPLHQAPVQQHVDAVVIQHCRLVRSACIQSGKRHDFRVTHRPRAARAALTFGKGHTQAQIRPFRRPHAQRGRNIPNQKLRGGSGQKQVGQQGRDLGVQ